MPHDALKIESTGGTRRTTRQRHIPHASTVAALSARRKGISLRTLAKELGYGKTFAPTLGSVLQGKAGVITPATERELRQRLGLTTSRPAAHRPYITDPAEWADFQAWRAARKQEGEG